MNQALFCNDIHSKLNPTWVSEIVRPESECEVVAAVRRAKEEDIAISICGGRHAMGGQQFGQDTMLLDMTALAHVGLIDRQRGTVEVGAGLKWPDLISALHARQQADDTIWSIRQKQTGADSLTLGGALAANIHGRGLLMAPIIADVEGFRIVDAGGEVHHCSRLENSELFRLAIGGYGCFGVITSVTLRLAPRIRLARAVRVTTLDLLPDTIRRLIDEGSVYGDFQFSIDENSDDFLHKGVLSTYRPTADDSPIPESQELLGIGRWEKLVHMAHHDRGNIFSAYSGYYLTTNGNRYWSDTHQLSIYVDDYHAKLDAVAGNACKGSEMITELYVPHRELIPFMEEAAQLLREHRIPVIYGTMRLIARDDESFLAWAREDMACVIFNLHTEHTDPGIALAVETFRSLIDLAISHGGSYFLTYHRWATQDQIERAHPRFRDFLLEKIRRDPTQRFQSEWWRHHRDMFGISQG